MQGKPKVYVLDPYHADAIALLQSFGDIHVVLPTDPRKSDWYSDADGLLLRSETRLGEADFKEARKLRVIVKQGAGVDNIDLEAAKAAGVAVHNTPALNSEAVAELCLALTLSLSRRVCEIDRRIRRGEKVVRSQTLGLSLFQKTIGIIGMGNIGRESARKWKRAFDAKIIGYDPVVLEDAWADIEHTRVKNVDQLLREADVVSLHVPLLPTTRGMIGTRELGLMKKQAILINAARGGLVDEKALLVVLKQGRIWGAVLDAMEVEPPTKESCGEFLELDNVIVTPHIGASTIENQSNSGSAAVRILRGVLRGDAGVVGKLV
ncbi:putative D-3-phosphoglycerate dehydrogenase [Trematosphaeria pertusa]|uniref:Putative D-3-phosphoglycerate dehydrogenase n=1 Tax=Trematosphaeria pertusa TaxID=390896 RepID=A0A6A6IXA6_9PLEO|nr:putative D-3-phosphoglycerate dehydrogenase [Trematosphaeria pertusa]KAF2255171.1 putative D-3-phosphoglycerate dehydrogenase [Trematosphaeria pertusa]